MQNNSSFVKIDLTPEYKRNLKDLAKKYRNIRSDTQSILTELQKGNFLGERLQGFGINYFIYKVRVKIVISKKAKAKAMNLITVYF